MSADFLPSAANGLYAAVATGLFGLATSVWLRRREKPARRDAWQQQAATLRKRLDDEHNARIADKDAELARRHAEIAGLHAEIRRLNKILNRRGGYD